MPKKEEKEVKCFFILGDSYCQAPTNKNFDIFGNETTPDKRACRKDLDACKQYHENLERHGGIFSRE